MIKFFYGLAAWLALFACVWSSAAQSGRNRANNPPPNQTEKPRPAENTAAVVLPAPIVTPTPTPTPAPDGPQTVGEDDIVRVTSTLVGIPASVIDADGKPFANLQAEDFELFIDGARQEFGALNRYESPVRLALLYDNSSSQNPARKLAREAAVKFFQRVLRRQDQAALILVSSAPMLVQPLTGDVKKLVATIENFPKPAGATALFDSIMLASDQLRLSNGRRVIIMVTDGEDTFSETNFDQALAAAQAADCQIYVVQTGYLDSANLRRLGAERRLEQFAAQTGGAVYTPLDKKDLPAAFDQIANDLAQQYVISYYPPASQPADGQLHTIAVRVKNHPEARIRARQGYYAKQRAAR